MHLAAVGLDEHKRQNLVIWHLQKDPIGSIRADILCQTISYANVKFLKWSPYDSDRFFTSGRDNVRMLRIKEGKLRSLPINMTEIATRHHKKKIFTCLGFCTYLQHGPSQKWIFSATSSGSVFQIDYKRFSIPG